MKKVIKRLLGRIFYSMGLDVKRHVENQLGLDPRRDMTTLLRAGSPPVIFDVGANKGQSVKLFKAIFRDAIIHSFEPSATTFETLKRKTKHYRSVHLNNFALGNVCETQTFYENSRPTMSSFLEPSKYCWGEIVKENPVEVRTLDDYAEANGVRSIDILKSDTQGFDLEVLKGARSLMAANRIHMIYVEVIFSDMYKNLPPFDEFFRFMIENNFKLVALYRFVHQDNVASWADSLFVNPEYEKANPALSQAIEHRDLRDRR